VAQLEQVIDAMRERILSGAFEPGMRLMEIPLARMLGVSRTPIRLALSVLEKEQLVVAGGPHKGFAVNSFGLEEVFDAIEARGTLEGMAARKLAERGLPEDAARILRSCIEDGARLLAEGVIDDETASRAWVQNNVKFHQALVTACGSRAIAIAIEHLHRIPLTAPAAVVLSTGDHAGDLQRLHRAQDDHAEILAAIESGQGMRAEMLMREHALMSIRNKRLYFSEIKARKAAGNLPGLDLVGVDSMPEAKARRRRRGRSTASS
jgi:GntR family transcriptional regulator, vanillate catabolism transcriptional regulator